MAIPQMGPAGSPGEGPGPKLALGTQTSNTHLVRCELPGVVAASKGLASLGPRKETSGKDLN